jgi:hypothetical protein
MGTQNHATPVTGTRVLDIAKVKNVIDGVVTATPRGLMRTLCEARYLLSRLASWPGAASWTLRAFTSRPAGPAKRWAAQPALMAGAHWRCAGRLGRPRSAGRSARF